MVFRRFPELAHIAVVHHKHFSFLGIENVHILEYKAPAEIFRKNILLFFEKTLRRIRWVILKLDNAISKAIEYIQAKHQAPAAVRPVAADYHPAAPAASEPEVREHMKDAAHMHPADNTRIEPQPQPATPKRIPIQHIQQPRESAPRTRRPSTHKRHSLDIKPPEVF